MVDMLLNSKAIPTFSFGSHNTDASHPWGQSNNDDDDDGAFCVLVILSFKFIKKPIMKSIKFYIILCRSRNSGTTWRITHLTVNNFYNH